MDRAGYSELRTSDSESELRRSPEDADCYYCRAFEVILGESIRNSGQSGMALLRSALSIEPPHELSKKLLGVYIIARAATAVVRYLVFAAVLFPIVILYKCGLYISTGISLWRLVQHDYSDADGDIEKANLKSAMDALYLVALVQGLLFFYRLTYVPAGRKIVGKVVEEYLFGAWLQSSVWEYLHETTIGCEKDPSFANGRNLVTYAFGLMKSESSGSYLSGARILDGILAQPALKGQHSMIAQLIASASCSQIVEKLLLALDSRSRQDKEFMELASRIVLDLAGEIHLNRFPQGILCISSLLETSQLQADDDSAPPGDFKVLMMQGLAILDRLAADKQNCRAICEAPGLLFKVMAPITSDMLHHIDHVEWSGIAAASLQVMCRIVNSPGRTGNSLRNTIWKNTDVIDSMVRILECDACDEKLYILAIKILTKLPMSAVINVDSESPGKFIKTLAVIFTSETKDSSIRKLAGEALAMLSERYATIFLKVNGGVVNDLSEMLVNAEDNTYRLRAAETLKHLCMHYLENDDYFKKLMEAMKDVMPKVLIEILPRGRGSTRKEVQAGNETDKYKYRAPGADLEDGHDGCDVSQDASLDEIISSLDQKDEQPVDRKLHAALLSLCTAIFYKLISDGHDLTTLVNTIVSKDAAFSFVRNLKEMVRINNKPTANCLMIMKNISKMVILMMQHGGWYVKVNLENFDSLMLSLSSASNNMFALEGFMIFSSSDPHAMRDFDTLTSLVNEAQKLLDKNKTEHQCQQLAVSMEAS